MDVPEAERKPLNILFGRKSSAVALDTIIEEHDAQRRDCSTAEAEFQLVELRAAKGP